MEISYFHAMTFPCKKFFARNTFTTVHDETSSLFLTVSDLKCTHGLTAMNKGGGGGSDACAVYKNRAYYRMRMGIIGDQFVHSVADDLNIHYEQFPCVGTPKFQFHIDSLSLESRLMKVGAFYEATAELKGFH